MRLPTALLMLTMAAALAGCQSNETIVQPVRDPILSDIPKPPGFSLVNSRSTAFASGQWRLAKCEYTGSMERDRLRRFYEQYMPQAGFELRQWNLEAGTLTMMFESAAETCNIRLRPSGNRTIVQLELAPLAIEPVQPPGGGGPPGAPRRPN